MHRDERHMISEQLSELFDLANDIRRRIDELAEMVANQPAPAEVHSSGASGTCRQALTRKRSPTDLASRSWSGVVVSSRTS